MVPQTFFWKIKNFFPELYEKVKWHFAEKWLNETFGKREYWGSEIAEMIMNQTKINKNEHLTKHN